MIASTQRYTGFGSNASGGYQLNPAAQPINKPPAGLTYGSGIGGNTGIGSGIASSGAASTGASSGSGSDLADTMNFAGSLLSSFMGGGSAGSSALPQSRRMAGGADFFKALQAVSSNNSGGFTDMGEGFVAYQPPRPGAKVTEKTKSEGGSAGSRSAGSRIAGGATGALGGAAAGAKLGSVVPGLGTGVGAGIGAVAGGLGGLFG